MRQVLVIIFLLNTVVSALGQTPTAKVILSVQQLTPEEQRKEDTDARLQNFEFEAEIHDPTINLNNPDLFTNAENSYKEKPRKQNVFVHVTRRDTGAAVPFVLYDRGSGGGNEGPMLSLELLVPFPAEERASRIAAAVKATGDSAFLKLLKAKDITPQQVFDANEFQESKPGEYVVRVEYIAPSGKVTSEPLPFTIRDKGNLYEKYIRAVKPDA